MNAKKWAVTGLAVFGAVALIAVLYARYKAAQSSGDAS